MLSTLEVQIRRPDETVDYALSLADREVTVAEVFEALGLPEATTIAGQLVSDPTGTPALAVLSSGVRLEAPGAPEPAEMPRNNAVRGGRVEVSVVSGFDAGRVRQLQPGLHRIRPGSQEAAAECTGWVVDVQLDAGASEGVARREAAPWHEHGSTVEVAGGSTMAFGCPVQAEAGHGNIVYRPPRAVVPGEVDAIELSPGPAPVQEPSPLSWATLLAPVPIAIMMGFFFRPIFAVFAAMGPIVALGRWYESRRRFRRDTKVRQAVVAQRRQATIAAAASQAEAEAQRRWCAHPHVPELLRRAMHRSVRLWERRPHTAGFLTVMVAVGTDQMDARTDGGTLDDEVHASLRSPLALRPVPHVIDLMNNTGLGVYGSRHLAIASVRAVVLQLATLQGPSDLRIGVLCSPEAAADWDWLKWLPHASAQLTAHDALPIVRSLCSSGAEPVRKVAATHHRTIDRVDLVIVDDPGADVAALRRAAHEADSDLRIIALAEHPTQLPAVCSSLVGVTPEMAEIATPELLGQRSVGRPVGVTSATAVAWAQALSGLRDPELTDFRAEADDEISLLRLVNFTSPEDLRSRWAQREASASPSAAIGVGAAGPFAIDLCDDGPHVLVAGTTGSGKSELLRTMVVALAAQCPPTQLNFVLVDFKGGGAFDVVNQLPHVAGLITDLDETMVARAIGSLRAELHRRESLFRDLGVSDYEAAAHRSSEPPARLAIVIDEFAALATDYPELMASIIDLAARGRSLGMHLVLATQRPSGVVDQKIRANTNLRVALRVQDAFDSQDVVGVADAAEIDRKAPGRAIFRVGGDRPVAVQTAYSGRADRRSVRCAARRYQLFAEPGIDVEIDDRNNPSEIEVLLEAICQVAAVEGFEARALWSDPLPATLDWVDLGARGLVGNDAEHGRAPTTGTVAVGLVDLPERQTQVPWRWDLDSGALVIFGSSADAAGKTLVSIGAAIAANHSPEEAHLYVIDGDAGCSAPLEELTHTGAYVRLAERDRIDRTLRYFENALASRRMGEAAESARLVLLIDNLASIVAGYDDVSASQFLDRLVALARDGSAQRLHLVITARTARDVIHRLAQQIPHRLVMELADPNGYLTLGLKTSEVIDLPPMRALDLNGSRLVQIVEPPSLSTWPAPPVIDETQLPITIGSFPVRFCSSDLPAANCDAETLAIPIGIDAADLTAATIELAPGEHILVVGSPGMGRSTLLVTIAKQLSRSAGAPSIIRIAPQRSPLAASAVPGARIDTAEQITTLAAADAAVLVLVDDADRVADDLGAALMNAAREHHNLRIVATAPIDVARSVRSWIAPLRSSAEGVLLGGTQNDGDLFRTRLDRLDGLGVIPGRGFLVTRGRARSTQFAIAANHAM